MSNSPEQEKKLIPSHHMVRLPTLMIWLGLWSTVVAVCLMLASMSLSGILSAGPEPLETSSSTTKRDSSTAQTSLTTSQTESSEEDKPVSLPIWLFAVLGCASAGGAFFVTQVLMRSSAPPRLTKKSPQRRKVNRSKVTKLKHGKKQVARANRQQKPRVARPQTQPQSIPQAPQTNVTVLSSQERSPLDNREESLADLMDIRKRGSMPNVMGR